MEQANQACTQVPLDVLERSVRAAELAQKIAREGNPASVSDAGVAGACALAAAEGAALNVRINIPSVTDEAAAKKFADRQDELMQRARVLADETRKVVDEVLSAS